MKEVLLVSGGIDSTVMMYREVITKHNEIFPLYVNFGQKNGGAEYHALSKVYSKLISRRKESFSLFHGIRVIRSDISGVLYSGMFNDGIKAPDHDEYMNRDNETVIPLLKIFLVSIATFYADQVDAKTVLIGSHKGSRLFHERLNELITEFNEKRIELSVPFMNWDKEDIVNYANEMDVPLYLTHSCYEIVPCHKCAACQSRNQVIPIVETK
jgi:7-cyano-7-deazaguanine synthase